MVGSDFVAQRQTDVATAVTATPLVPELRLRLFDPAGGRTPASLFGDGELQPYWAFAWGSGQAMARFLLDRPELVRGRAVYDFGAGSGIASIAAAKAGAARVVANDVDPLAVAAVHENALLNDVTIETRLGDAVRADFSGFDVLLASDAFFHWPGNEEFVYGNPPVETILLGLPNHRGLARGREYPRHRLQELAAFDVRTFPEIELGGVNRAGVYRWLPQ